MATSATPHDLAVPGPAGSFWARSLDDVLAAHRSDRAGLSAADAAERRRTLGPNTVERAGGHRGARLLAAQFASPIIVILAAATVLSMVLGDITDGAIILAIILASGLLGFWQERSAGRAVDALLARVRVHVEVLRDAREATVPVDDVVPGDVVVLQGNLKTMPETLGELHLLPLAERDLRIGRKGSLVPIAVLAAAMGLVAFNLVPVAVAFFGAAVLLLLFRSLSLSEAYDAVEDYSYEKKDDLVAWLERRPLHGKRVVVTRARAQASGLAATLSALGAVVLQAGERDAEAVLEAAGDPLLRIREQRDDAVDGVDGSELRIPHPLRVVLSQIL